MRKVIIIVCLLLALIGFGCAALSEYITPATIDQKAVEYVVINDCGYSSEYDGYPSVFKAERLKKAVDVAHASVQLRLQQLSQSDDFDYGVHKSIVTSNVIVGRQREELLFGQTGLLSMLLPAVGLSAFTGLLGLMRKRPGDFTPQDVEQAIATVQGKTTEELTIKDRQFAQVVQGVQKFLDTWPATEVSKELKSIMDKMQDTDTQIAVATAKKAS